MDTRSNTRKRSHAASANSDSLLNHEPEFIFAPTAKPLASLTFDHQDQPGFVKHATDQHGHVKFFRKTNAAAAEMEAYNAACCRLLIGDNFAPSTKTYYTDDMGIQGVASSQLNNFRSNRENPLTLQDANIENAELSIYDFEMLHALNKTSKKQPDRHGFINFNIKRKKYMAKDSDLQHYAIMRGLARSLVTRYIFKEEDNHGRNFSKYGQLLDFEWTNYPISSRLKFTNPLASFFNVDHKTRFQCTSRDMREFPTLTDAKPFYWPTSQPTAFHLLMPILEKYLEQLEDAFVGLDQTVFDEISRISNEISCTIMNEGKDTFTGWLKNTVFQFLMNAKNMLFAPVEINDEMKRNIYRIIKANLATYLGLFLNTITIPENHINALSQLTNMFNTTDNEAYRHLSAQPTFMFHKFGMFFKYLLLGEEVYSALAGLYISPATTFLKNGVVTNLREAVISDAKSRFQEIRQILVNMPEFQTYVQEHGNKMLGVITDEISATHDKFKEKSIRKPYFRAYTDAIDPDIIKQHYAELTEMMNINQFPGRGRSLLLSNSF